MQNTGQNDRLAIDETQGTHSLVEYRSVSPFNNQLQAAVSAVESMAAGITHG